MISSVTDYHYVTGANVDADHPHGDMDRILIDGDIMPLREGTLSPTTGVDRSRILRGEDICFIFEAVAECYRFIESITDYNETRYSYLDNWYASVYPAVFSRKIDRIGGRGFGVYAGEGGLWGGSLGAWHALRDLFLNIGNHSRLFLLKTSPFVGIRYKGSSYYPSAETENELYSQSDFESAWNDSGLELPTTGDQIIRDFVKFSHEQILEKLSHPCICCDSELGIVNDVVFDRGSVHHPSAPVSPHNTFSHHIAYLDTGSGSGPESDYEFFRVQSTSQEISHPSWSSYSRYIYAYCTCSDFSGGKLVAMQHSGPIDRNTILHLESILGITPPTRPRLWLFSARITYLFEWSNVDRIIIPST